MLDVYNLMFYFTGVIAEIIFEPQGDFKMSRLWKTMGTSEVILNPFYITLWPWAHGNEKLECDGWNEIYPPQAEALPFPPEALWGGLEGTAMLKDICHWDWVLKFYSLVPLQTALFHICGWGYEFPGSSSGHTCLLLSIPALRDSSLWMVRKINSISCLCCSILP